MSSSAARKAVPAHAGLQSTAAASPPPAPGAKGQAALSSSPAMSRSMGVVGVASSSGGVLSGGSVAYVTYESVRSKAEAAESRVLHLQQELDAALTLRKSQLAVAQKHFAQKIAERDAALHNLVREMTSLSPEAGARAQASVKSLLDKDAKGSKSASAAADGAVSTADMTAEQIELAFVSAQAEVAALRSALLQAQAARQRHSAFTDEAGPLLEAAAGNGCNMGSSDVRLLLEALQRCTSAVAAAATESESSANNLISIAAAAEVQSLRSQVSEEKNRRASVTEKLAKEQDRVAELSKALERLTSSSTAATSEMGASLAERDGFVTRISALEAEAASLRAEVSSLRRDLDEAHKEVEMGAMVAMEADHRANDLEQKLTEAMRASVMGQQSSTPSPVAASTSASASSAVNDELQRKCDALEAETANLKRSLEETQQKLDAAAAQVTKLTKQEADLRTSLAASERAKVEASLKLELMAGQASSAKDKIAMELAATKEKLAAETAAVAAAEAEVGAMREQLQRLQTSTADELRKFKVDAKAEVDRAVTTAVAAAVADATKQHEAARAKLLQDAAIEKAKQTAVANEEIKRLQAIADRSAAAEKKLRERLAPMAAAVVQVRAQQQAIERIARNDLIALQKDFVAGLTRATTAVSSYAENYALVLAKYKRELAERRRVFNLLQELRGNIRVFARVRPPAQAELSSAQSVADAGLNPVCVSFPDEGQLTLFNNKRQVKSWEFDSVFPPSATNEAVFREVEDLVVSCADGYNVCLFAYGQTGSGKTHTMEGPPDNRGVNYRALERLFGLIEQRKEDQRFEVKVAMLEIYNENIQDMLAPPSAASSTAPKLVIRDGGPSVGIYVQDLTSVSVSSAEDVYRLMRNGYGNRTTFATNMNEHSSRSHCIVSVTVAAVHRTTGEQVRGKLNLIDLAGSERVGRSGASGDRLKEAQAINKSLSALGDVIAARAQKLKHVPYRNSTLTYLLQDSLSGDSKTLMFLCLSPLLTDADESFCSLNFAARVRNVELGLASKHVKASGSGAGTPAAALDDDGPVDENDETEGGHGGPESGASAAPSPAVRTAAVPASSSKAPPRSTLVRTASAATGRK
jgi:kinesin family protein C2/C3